LWLNPDSIRGFEGLRAKFAGGIGCVILLSIGSVGDGRAQGTVPAPAAAADADTIPPATISDFGSAGTATGHVSVYPPNRRYPESAAAASGTLSWQWYDPRWHPRLVRNDRGRSLAIVHDSGVGRLRALDQQVAGSAASPRRIAST
jgi:hypothetical protein